MPDALWAHVHLSGAIVGFSSDAVANRFLELAERDGRTVSPMKLQKLMYYAHGWHMAADAGELVDDEFQAWDYGPVLATIYHEFSDFGNQPITRRAFEVRAKDGKAKLYAPAIRDEASEAGDENKAEFSNALIEAAWDIYGPYDAVRLSHMTHEKGTPWWTVRQRAKKQLGIVPKGLHIPNSLIREWFKARTAENSAPVSGQKS